MFYARQSHAHFPLTNHLPHSSFTRPRFRTIFDSALCGSDVSTHVSPVLIQSQSLHRNVSPDCIIPNGARFRSSIHGEIAQNHPSIHHSPTVTPAFKLGNKFHQPGLKKYGCAPICIGIGLNPPRAPFPRIANLICRAFPLRSLLQQSSSTLLISFLPFAALFCSCSTSLSSNDVLLTFLPARA